MSEAEEFMNLYDLVIGFVDTWVEGKPDEVALAAYKIGNGNIQEQVKRFASARSTSDGGELLAAIVAIDVERERELGFCEPEDEELMPF